MLRDNRELLKTPEGQDVLALAQGIIKGTKYEVWAYPKPFDGTKNVFIQMGLCSDDAYKDFIEKKTKSF